jgi:hypothetical protein
MLTGFELTDIPTENTGMEVTEVTAPGLTSEGRQFELASL